MTVRARSSTRPRCSPEQTATPPRTCTRLCHRHLCATQGRHPDERSLVLACPAIHDPNRSAGGPASAAHHRTIVRPTAQISQHLTVGTFDADQNPMQWTGRVAAPPRWGPHPPPKTRRTVSDLDMNDVRLAGGLDDYAVELTVSSEARITDRENRSVRRTRGSSRACRSSSWRTRRDGGHGYGGVRGRRDRERNRARGIKE